MLGKDYTSVEKGLMQYSKRGPGRSNMERGLVEPSMKRLLAGHPALFEEGASCNGVEVDVGAGVADLILSAKDERQSWLSSKSTEKTPRWARYAE